MPTSKRENITTLNTAVECNVIFDPAWDNSYKYALFHNGQQIGSTGTKDNPVNIAVFLDASDPNSGLRYTDYFTTGSPIYMVVETLSGDGRIIPLNICSTDFVDVVTHYEFEFCDEISLTFPDTVPLLYYSLWKYLKSFYHRKHYWCQHSEFFGSWFFGWDGLCGLCYH